MPARVVITSGCTLFILAVSPRSLGAQDVRDSGSVRVLRYSRDAVPPKQWTLDPEPLLEIGGVTGQGPSEFAEIRGIVRLQDGHVAVANGGSNEIRIFSQNGTFQTSVG